MELADMDLEESEAYAERTDARIASLESALGELVERSSSALNMSLRFGGWVLVEHEKAQALMAVASRAEAVLKGKEVDCEPRC